VQNLKYSISIIFMITGLFTSHSEKGLKTELAQKGPLSNQTLRYLALGDSYTIGTVIGQENSYASLLAKNLAATDFVDSVYLKIIAQEGWTTANLQQGINEQAPDSNYHFVSILIGVNNQYQKRGLLEYRKELSSLLKQSIGLAQHNKERVLVLSIPDWGSTPSGDSLRPSIAGEINAFNKVKKQLSDSLGLTYIDLTEISRTAVNKSNLVAQDKLHFSAEMHHLWVNHIVSKLNRNIFKNNRH
jgi:lysophospholipase L1-like esterase